ncbi:MAG: amino acid ABC transporter substrate-binding protein [Pseudomonadota bacterium]
MGKIYQALIAGLIAAPLAGTIAAADVLSQIEERGAIRLGIRPDAPPFSYLTEAGEPAGLAVALCRSVVAAMARQLGRDGLDVRFVPVNARGRFDALITGRTDLHCGPASATLPRRETLDFSMLYFVDGAAAVVRPATYDSVKQIADGRIGVSAGTTTEGMVREMIDRGELDAALVTFQSHELGLRTLKRGRIDAYFGDSGIMRFQMQAMGLDDDLTLLPQTFSFEPYALVMKRGETRLRLAVDRALSGIYRSGKIYELIKQELGDYRLSPLGRAVYQIVGLPG